jgi:hypothetical protein
MDEPVVSVAAACPQSLISLLHPIGKSIGRTIITGVAISLMRGSLQYAPQFFAEPVREGLRNRSCWRTLSKA